MIELSPAALRGSFPPLVTPFHEGRVDVPRFEKLVEHQIACGSHGVVVTGTSGEPAMLTVDERTTLFHAAVGAAAGRVPVIAATGAGTLQETVALTRAAEAAGAAAVLVVTPYYSKPSDDGVVRYYEVVCGATGLPVLVYHIPGRSGLALTPQVVERIAARCPTMVGVKHSAYDLRWVTEVIARLGSEFRLLVGVEELSFPMLAVGACGLVNAAANVAPSAVRALYEAVAAGDLLNARRLHYELYELNCAVFWETNPAPVKYLMWRMGLLDSNEHRLPMAPVGPAVQRRLDALLDRAGPLVSRPAR